MQNGELNEKVLRVLAEAENMRERVMRQADQARKFAVEVRLRMSTIYTLCLEKDFGTW